ncbi:MAG: hypothetical protein IBX72_14470 [Nitrospirae bacterium]|jgi:hypothetical protein|nr:hypothetical protein [Nitrospirota bacterium]
MKRRTIKILKRASRKKIPVSSMREKVITSKKRKLIEKALKKDAVEHGER